MVFIRKINNYYVLSHSIRRGSKVVQKTRYLGQKLPSENTLIRLKRKFLEEIAEKRYRYFSLEEIKTIEDKKKEHHQAISNLSPLEREKTFKDFMIRYTYDSSKLSGVEVTLRQTFLILKDGVIPKDFKNLKTVKELENHQKGIVAMTDYKGSLNLHFLKKLHLILFSGVDDGLAGKLRSELKKNVRIGGTPYVPPKWDQVDKELGNFFKWYRAENRQLHPLELAALVHLRLISLQPFADGNSRLSRLLMNWILWKKKYPLVDIGIEDLEDYYDVLDKYQVEHQEKPFVRYIKEKYLMT